MTFGFRSPITRRIMLANISGLLVLIFGALVLNEIRAGYVATKAQDLMIQAEVFTNLIEEQATIGEPMPALEKPAAGAVVRRMNLPAPLRLIISDVNGERVADSFLLSNRVDLMALPPVRANSKHGRAWRDFSGRVSNMIAQMSPRNFAQDVLPRSFHQELADAFGGEVQASQRLSERGQRIVSVTVPIRRVSSVVGYLTLESSDIEAVIRTERFALLPFILLAVIVAILTSINLSFRIGRPLSQLSSAAEEIKRGEAERLDLPRLLNRKDEIGTLTTSMDAMTRSLMTRISANAAFAADVAHELKNPLTAIRSAVETAELVKHDPSKLDTLLGLIAHDVHRLDRLITDISNASRLEADLNQAPQKPVEMVQFCTDLVAHYDPQIASDGKATVTFKNTSGEKQLRVRGREGGLEQIFTNLIDNARSFAPPDTPVKVELTTRGFGTETRVCVMIEDWGPGIPTEKLDTIFDRFYSDRPEGSRGNNSGLGLSIARQIVEIHRGTIYAKNRPEGGACFVVELPKV